MKSWIKKADHLFQNTVAWLILEPRFRSCRWEITDSARAKLKPKWDSLMETYDRGHEFFNKVDMCAPCTTPCCSGNFNRFDVYDHITHQLMQLENPPDWQYKLLPVGSYEKNRVEEGMCSQFVPGKGCGLPYRNRPAVCIWYTCGKMSRVFDTNRKLEAGSLRDDVDRVHREYIWTLLFGGMRRVPRRTESA